MSLPGARYVEDKCAKNFRQKLTVLAVIRPTTCRIPLFATICHKEKSISLLHNQFSFILLRWSTSLYVIYCCWRCGQRGSTCARHTSLDWIGGTVCSLGLGFGGCGLGLEGCGVARAVELGFKKPKNPNLGFLGFFNFVILF